MKLIRVIDIHYGMFDIENIACLSVRIPLQGHSKQFHYVTHYREKSFAMIFNKISQYQTHSNSYISLKYIKTCLLYDIEDIPSPAMRSPSQNVWDSVHSMDKNCNRLPGTL